MLLGLTAAFHAQSARAAITWGAPTTIAGDTDVLNVGAFSYGYDFANSTQTVNGVTFTGTNSTTTVGANLTLGSLGTSNVSAFTSTSNPFNSLSTAYKAMLIGSSYGANNATATVTLNSLTASHVYAVQFWVNDPRPVAGRYETLTSSGGNSVILNFSANNVAGSPGQYSIGGFAASAAIQAFTLTPGNSSTPPQINAVQVRDVTGLWSGASNGTWDSGTNSTNLNFTNNNNFSTVKGLVSAAYFADTDGFGNAITSNNISIAAGGVQIGTVTFQNKAVNYTLTSSDTAGITGATAVVAQGTGIVTFAGSNSYTGSTTISSGTMQFQGNRALPGTSAVSLGSATLQIYNDGTGNNGTISLGSSITLSAATTTDVISTGNLSAVNTGNTVAFGVLSNGTSANAFTSTFNFTGANGYLQSYSGLRLAGLTGNTTTLNPTSTSVTIAGNVTNQESGSVTGHFDTLDLDGTSSGSLISGVISDAAGFASVGNGDTRITKSNTSVWTLTGSNTYHGPTTISGGTLVIGGAGVLGSGTYGGAIANSAALVVNTTSNETFGGVISGNGGFYLLGSALTSLTGASTYTGATLLGAGTLQAGAATVGGASPTSGALGVNSALTVNGGATLNLNGFNETIGSLSDLAGSGGTITSGAAGAITVITGGNNSSTSFAGAIVNGAGTVSLTKTGSGTQTLSGGNSYSGTTTITGGDLVFTPAATVATGSVVIQSGALAATGPAAPVNLSSATAWLASGKIAGSSSGALALVQNDASNFNFTSYPSLSLGAIGASTYSGTMTPANSTYRFGGGGGALTVVPSLSGANSVVANGGGAPGTVILTNANSYSGGTTIAAGTLQLGDGAALTGSVVGNILDNGSLVFANPSALSYSGSIGGSGGVVLNGPGLLNLSGSNTYLGNTTIGGGTLQAANLGAIGASGMLAVNSGVFDCYGNSFTFTSLSGTGGGVITDSLASSGTTTLTINQASSTTYAGSIVDGPGRAIAVARLGSGGLTLSGSSSFSGGTTIMGTSSVTVLNNAALGAGPVTVGDPIANSPVLILGNGITLTNPLTITSGTSGAGRGTLQVAAGNSATYNGAMTLAGSNLDTLTSAGTMTVQGTVGGSAGTYFLRGASPGVGFLQSVLNIGATTLNKTDAGTWIIGSTGNSWGNTQVSVGTLRLGVEGALPVGTLLTMGQGDSNTATWDLNGFNPQIGGLILAPNSTGAKTVTNSSATPDTLTISTSGNYSYGGVISGALSLDVSGTGTQLLTGANTYTGATTANGGTLIFGTGGSINNSTGITINSGGAVQFSGAVNSNPIGSANMPITVNSGGTLAVTTGNSMGYSAQANYANIALNGGYIGLSAIQYINSITLTGGTVGGSGALQFWYSVPAAIICTTTGTISSGINFNNMSQSISVSPGGALAISGVIAANGWTEIGGGLVVLSASNTYTGGTTINGGTLELANANAVQGSTVTLNVDNGLTFFPGIGTFNAGGLAGYNLLTLADTSGGAIHLSVGASGASSTFGGNIGGAGSLAKAGGGTFGLTGSNGYSGGTAINGGGLIFAAANSLPATGANGDITIAPGAGLGVAGPYSTVTDWLNSGRIATSTSGAIALTAASSENIDLTMAAGGAYTTIALGSIGTNTYSGTLTSAGSTYYLGGGGGTLVMPNNGALVDSATGSRSLVTEGSVALAGSNGFTGAVTINNGTLNFAGGYSIGNGTAITLAGGTLQYAAGNTYDITARTVTLGAGGGAIDPGPNSVTLVGSIGGSGGLTKVGTGTLTLAGATSNSFTGNLIVDNGSLYLNKSGAAVAVAAGTTVQMGGGDTNEPNLRMSANNQFGAGVVMTFVNASGNWTRFDLQGTIQTLSGLSCSTAGGVVQNYGIAGTPPPTSTGASILTLNLANGSSYSYNGYLRDMDNSAHTYLLGLTLSGSGAQTFSGANITYQGPTTVSGGTLVLQNATAFASPIANSSTVVFNAATAGQTGAAITGSGTWIKTGTGDEQFNGTNQVIAASGQFYVTQGTLQNNNNSTVWFGNTAGMNISSGAIFNLYADPVFIDTLSGSGTISNTYGNTTGYSGASAFTERLTIGVAGGSSTFSGALTDTGTAASGTGKGLLELWKSGSGTIALTGSNSYSGLTTLDGGTLKLDFSAAGAPLNNIINSVSNSSSLVMGGGGLLVTGNPGAANSQQFNGLTLNANPSSVQVISGGTTTLTLGAIVRNLGATLDFTLPSSGSVTTTTANASFGLPTILGGYATVGGSTWAVSGTGAGTFALTALSSYAGFAAGANVDAPAGDTAVPGLVIYNSLRLNNSGSCSLDLNSGNVTIASGGILETANVGPNSAMIDGVNTLTSGNGQDLIVIQNNTAAAMSIAVPVVGTIGLTKAGPGMLMLAASNTYTGATYVTGGTLQVDAVGALPATALNVLAGTLDFNGFNYTTGASVNIGGGPGGTSAAINIGTGVLTLANSLNYSNPNAALGATISASGTGGLNLTGTQTVTVGNGPAAVNDLTISANISGPGSLTKAGAGNLLLSGSNTYAGPTTISGGTLTTGANALPSTMLVSFGGNASLNVGATNPVLSSLTVANSTTGTIMGMGSGGLTLNASGFFVGNTSSGTAQLNMAGLPSFTYNGPGSTFRVGGNANDSANEYGVLTLAANNSITASLLQVGGAKSVSAAFSAFGTMFLGQSNAFDADTFQLGANQSNGTVEFQSGLSNPALTIRGSAGGTSRATVNIGTGDSSNYEPSVGNLDLVTGVRGASQLNALIGTMTMGNPGYGTGGNAGTFSMGGGTLDATTIIVGANNGTGGSVTGTFSLNGGTALVQTVTIGNMGGSGAVTGIVNLNSGVLSAGNIAAGTNAATRTFNWNFGTIANYNQNYGLTGGTAISGLTISIPTMTMAGSGTHTFWIDAGQTGTVSAAIGEAGGSASLNKAGPGILVLGGSLAGSIPTAASSFSGNVTINAGTLVTAAVATGSDTVLGSASSTRTITVNAGATLQFDSANTLGTQFNSTNIPTLAISGGTVTNADPFAGTSGSGTINNALGSINLTNGVLTATTGQNGGYAAWNVNGTITSSGNSLISTSDPVNGTVMLSSTASVSTGVFNVLNGTLLVSAPLVQDMVDSNIDSLTEIGAGTLILSGTNTYSGGTIVEGGTLIAASSGALEAGTSLTVGQGASAFFAPALASPLAAAAAEAAAVPEPGALALLAASTALLAVYRRRPSRSKRG
jgi:fibronectin-binding autotransporter adhesin